VSKLDGNGNYVAAAGMVGAQGGDSGTGIALDSVGNVFTTGHIRETTDFDPTSGTYDLIPNGSSDIFVSKLTQPGAGPMGMPPASGGKGSDGIAALTTARPANLPILDLAAIDLSPIFVGNKSLDAGEVQGSPRLRADFTSLLTDEIETGFDVSQ
jgi:hypothetical protein